MSLYPIVIILGIGFKKIRNIQAAIIRNPPFLHCSFMDMDKPSEILPLRCLATLLGIENTDEPRTVSAMIFFMFLIIIYRGVLYYDTLNFREKGFLVSLYLDDIMISAINDFGYCFFCVCKASR